jgi:hypothetical protein
MVSLILTVEDNIISARFSVGYIDAAAHVLRSTSLSKFASFAMPVLPHSDDKRRRGEEGAIDYPANKDLSHPENGGNPKLEMLSIALQS